LNLIDLPFQTVGTQGQIPIFLRENSKSTKRA
jgi:hypothetical protein